MTIDRIITEVAKTYGTTPEDIRGKKRSAQVSNARKVAIYIIRDITELPLKTIGSEFNRDHSTMVYAIDDVEKNMKTDSHFKGVVEDIIKNVRDN